jgi:outer membrane protein assembly factor BamD (BamD/ComL family)
MPKPSDLKGLVLFLGLALFILIAAVVRADERSAPAADMYNKAVRLYEKGKWDQAREFFHQYLAEYSDSPLYVTCLYYLGYCYQRLGDAQEAISIYHKVMDEAQGGDAFWGEMAETRTKELESTLKAHAPE